MKQLVVYLLIALDEIAIGIALIFLIHYFTDLDWWIPGIIMVALFIILTFKFYVFYPQFRKPQTGKNGMIGSTGRALEPLKPEGQVKIRGKIWNAKSMGHKINKGEKIQVAGVEGLKLLVHKTTE